MAKRVTIKDVAKTAGLSITTVSQILNGKGERFPAATQEKVMKIRDQLGYVPNFNARNLISHSMKTVGIIVPNLVNPFFAMFLRGIQDAMYEHECVPMILSAERDEALEHYYLRTLVERGVDAMIIASSAVGNDEINGLLKRNNVPYLLFDQNDPINEGTGSLSMMNVAVSWPLPILSRQVIKKSLWFYQTDRHKMCVCD
ncbi:LacI family DNA-binding transcriptional regulator [Furfurilactobacillus rossiae]